MSWIAQAWYQIAWAEELLPGQLVARRVLDLPIVVFRGEDGAAAAVLDRCPHRFAPISTGSVAGNAIRCGYHGLAFDGGGRCVGNPHGAATQSLSVRSFPIVERHDALWVWTGEAAAADPDLVPDLSFIDQAASTARIRGYMPTRANYQLISDNIMDLSHADYIHPTTLGGMMTSATTRTVEQDGHVVTEWTALDCPEPPAVFRKRVPLPDNVDIRIVVDWQAPSIIKLGVSALPAGREPETTDQSWTAHIMTPETKTTTHYFYCATRRHRADDVAFSAFLRTTLEKAFLEEDKPMLEAQQASIGDADFDDLKPALLKIDTGAVRTRRVLTKRIAGEQADADRSVFAVAS